MMENTLFANVFIPSTFVSEAFAFWNCLIFGTDQKPVPVKPLKILYLFKYIKTIKQYSTMEITRNMKFSVH